MLRSCLFCVLLLVQLSCNSTHDDGTNTYAKTYNLDEEKSSSKEELISNLNNAISNLYVNDPQFSEFRLDNKVVYSEHSYVLDTKKVTSCWQRKDSLFEQVEIVYQKGEVIYMRADVFEGSSCTNLEFIRNVEKSFFEAGENRFTEKANDLYTFTYEGEEKVKFIGAIKAKLY